MEISVPVPGTDERPTGVLKVVADIREMLASVAGMDLGTDGNAMLLRRNGSIVFSRDGVQPSARFFASDRLKERLDEASTVSGPSRVFFTAVEPHAGSQIIGVATSQLASTFRTCRGSSRRGSRNPICWCPSPRNTGRCCSSSRSPA